MADPAKFDMAQWAASVEKRRRRGSRHYGPMPPWEEMAAFDLPITTIITVPPATVGVQVVTSKPNRVVLMMQLNGASGVFVSPTSEPVSGNGFTLINTQLPLIITQAQHGILCQCEWFANANMGSTLYVVEVVLREWEMP